MKTFTSWGGGMKMKTFTSRIPPNQFSQKFKNEFGRSSPLHRDELFGCQPSVCAPATEGGGCQCLGWSPAIPLEFIPLEYPMGPKSPMGPRGPTGPRAQQAQQPIAPSDAQETHLTVYVNNGPKWPKGPKWFIPPAKRGR